MAGDSFHIHDFCLLLNSFYGPVSQLFRNIFYLESIFYKQIYLIDDDSRHIYRIPQELRKGMQFELLNIRDIDFDKLGSIQEGDSFDVSYFYPEGDCKRETMLKNYKVLKYEFSENYSTITYYVKEKLVIRKKVSQEEFINQYELSFTIKKIGCRVLVYFKLQLHPMNSISSPFNKDVRTNLENALEKASKQSQFRENYENFDSILIKSKRTEVFSLIDSLRIYKGCEVFYSADFSNSKIFVGRQFTVILNAISTKLIFEIVDYFYSDDSTFDCRLTGKLIFAEPQHSMFSYTFTLKTINFNQQLVLFCHKFEDPIDPELMLLHRACSQTMLCGLKELAEENQAYN